MRFLVAKKKCKEFSTITFFAEVTVGPHVNYFVINKQNYDQENPSKASILHPFRCKI